MKKIIPLILLLTGIAAGIGAGLLIKPYSEQTVSKNACNDAKGDKEMASEDAEEEVLEYVEFNNQFIVPVVAENDVASLVVLSLGIELESGQSELVYQREPKLRDSFLQVLFDHANIGGFRGRFTDGETMDILRRSLTEAAQAVIGETVRSVMITAIARQDI